MKDYIITYEKPTKNGYKDKTTYKGEIDNGKFNEFRN